MEQLYAAAFSEPVFRLARFEKQDDLKWRGLLNALKVFDVTQLPPAPQGSSEFAFSEHSELAILHNILTRGMPTMTSLKIENALSEAFGFTETRSAGTLGNISTQFQGNHPSESKIFEALHFIDPRLDDSLHSIYNYQATDSEFERKFLFHYIGNSSGFIRQLLQPQTPLEEVVAIEQQNQFQGNRRADFALSSPYLRERTTTDQYGNEKEIANPTGYVVEVDGLHHQQEVIYDETRDQAVRQNGWQPFRVESRHEQDHTASFLNALQEDPFVHQCRTNAQKGLNGEWNHTLQFVLTPMAVARIQKTLLMYLLRTGETGKPLNIAFIERDVPCGDLAIQDMMQWLANLTELAGKISPLPEISWDVYSSPEFIESPLHHQNGEREVLPITEFPTNDHNYELVIDHSILRRSGIEKPLNTKNLVQIRSSHFPSRKINNQFLSAPTISYQQVCSQKENEVFITNEEHASKLRFFLQNIFRKKDFMEGQLPILNHAIQNKSVVGLLPTGGGKSLTYQLAALLQPGFTMVVDPIKSLMQDQYDNLFKTGIDAAIFINSSLNTEERNQAMGQLKSGQSMFCFISPERMVIEKFRKNLIGMAHEHKYFTYFVIDEVHCVSEWGHDFRTPYLNLAKNAVDYCQTYSGNPVPIFGLTATASFDVLSDVERELSTGQEIGVDAIIRFENTIRNELQYKIVPIEAKLDELKDVPVSEVEDPPPRIIEYNENEEPQNLSGFDLKKKIGEVKQGRMKQLLLEGELPQDFHQFNNTEVLKQIISQAFDNFLEQKDIEKFYHEWGYKAQYQGKEFAELTTNDQETVRNAIKNDYIYDQLSVIPLDLGEEFYDQQNANAGIIFCPHRRWLHGVTDRYRYATAPRDDYKYNGKKYKKGAILKDEDGKPVPFKNHSGIADHLSTDKLRIGTFLGSGDKYDEDSEKAQQDSVEYQDKFVNNELNLMVATKAFGMGMDKSNIRYTVHFNMPSSIESFVQESGRAGRDRQLAINYILFNQQEFSCWNNDARIALLKRLHQGNQHPAKSTLHSIQYWLTNTISGFMFRREDYEQLIHQMGEVDPNLPVQEILDCTPTQQVDKDNLLFFHSNAFKGQDKELSLIHELLTEITYPNYQMASLLSEYVSERIGRDVQLRFSNGKYSDYLWINNPAGGAFGFFRTDRNFQIRPYDTVVNQESAQQIMNDIYNALFELEELQGANDEEAKDYLQERKQGSLPGIGKWIHGTDGKNGQVKEFEIFFDNLYQNDQKTYKEEIRAFIMNECGQDYLVDDLSQRLNHAEDLEEFVLRVQYANQTNLEQYLLEHDLWEPLRNRYYAKRGREDTDKAIYRLQCLGIIEDYTIDYREGKYVVKARKQPLDNYLENYRQYIMRYYSQEWADQRMRKVREKLDTGNGDYLETILGDLINLVYTEVAKKRRIAIDDMIDACKEGLYEGNHAMKQFVYLYFNSKYARRSYTIDGEDYSLISPNHTNEGKEQSFEIVWKFTEAIHYDGSQQDNLKHLRGACMRVLRSNPENASALLLKAFSLFILAEKQKSLLNEAQNSFQTGFLNFRKQYSDWDQQSFNQNLHEFRQKVTQNTTDEAILKTLDQCIERFLLEQHNEWLKSFKPQFLENYG